MEKKILVEIWSDVLCPFCYIGKRHFEAALAQFAHGKNVEIIWKSFELDPNAEREYEGDIYDMLAKKFATSREHAKKMNQRVLEMAKDAGLNFDLDAVKPTNSFDAHRLIHLANTKGLQSEAEEKFFSAYFVEGRHLGSVQELKKISSEIGLSGKEADEVLSSEKFSSEVHSDESEARQLGVNGVPFFVFNRKYAASGAQPQEFFLELLQKIFTEE